MHRVDVPTTGFPSDDDTVLAQRATSDRDSFLQLYDRYVGSVERYVAARVASSNVEDLVSTIFTRALARIYTFQPDRGSFAAWLFTIARNAIVDHWRDQSRSVALGLAAEPSTGDPSPETFTIAAEEAHQVRAALEELTRDQRDALALRYAAGLSFSDVARTLGKSEPAAKMLVQRGLQALRRHFERDQGNA